MNAKKFLVSAVFFLAFASSASAARLTVLDPAIAGRLENAASAGHRVTLKGIDLGAAALDTIELEPLQVWAPDATIVVYGADGTSKEIPPPHIATFKGHVAGVADSVVVVSVDEQHAVHGLVMRGEKRYVIGRAVPAGIPRPRARFDERAANGPFVVGELDPLDSAQQPSTPWTCGVENQSFYQTHLMVPGSSDGKHKAKVDAGNVAGATYQLRIAIETDKELYAAFGNVGTLTTYLNNLVATASIVYQRDIATTLNIGTVHIWSGGTDPWTVTTSGTTSDALGEFGTYWHNNYSSVPRSTAVFISGKTFFGGIAWENTMCGADFYCGDSGANCGSSTLAGKYAGAYAFCGSTVVTTTIPDPTLTIGGVQYGMPSDNNFWMLAEMLHEVGHNANGPHTHCVALSSAQQQQYNVTRPYIDICYNGESGCYAGVTTDYPPELGTIMSYCHNLNTAGGFPASRYVFGKAGEPSELMFPYFRTGLENATPNGTITFTDIGTIACTAGHTASVSACTSCTYSWGISGGSITSATNGTSVTFTPSAPTVTLTATITTPSGCGITTSASAATACSALAAPTNVVAAAASSTSVTINWTASGGATSYEVWRSADHINYSLAGTSGTTSFTDSAAAASTAYLYKVRAVAPSTSAFSAPDLATTVIFTDPTLQAGVTLAKAAHINELRTAVNAVYTLAGLGTPVYTTAAPVANSSTIQAADITDLRTAITTARAAISLSAPTFTNVTITAGSSIISAVDISDLRAAVQ